MLSFSKIHKIISGIGYQPFLAISEHHDDMLSAYMRSQMPMHNLAYPLKYADMDIKLFEHIYMTPMVYNPSDIFNKPTAMEYITMSLLLLKARKTFNKKKGTIKTKQ